MHDQERTFKVERMLRATPTGQRFDLDGFDVSQYFGHAWQMIRGEPRTHVQIRFSAKVAGNVEEVLWHHTQQTQILPDGSMRFEVDVDGIHEIAWWVLGYGQEAVVEAPAELRDPAAAHRGDVARIRVSVSA